MDGEICTGGLWGIEISRKLCVLYRMFADDLGFFVPASWIAFEAVKRVIGCYEMASGAKLSLLKSIVIPFELEDIPSLAYRLRLHN